MEKSSSRSGNRLLLILTAAAVAAAAGYAFLHGTDVLRRGVSAPAAAFGGWTYDRDDQRRAAAALVKAGLTEYQWEDGRLLVPAARRGEYERVLGENGAMPQKPSALKQEDIEGLSAFESENRAKLRDLYSSARQLEKTLESFRQIESASVGPHARREQSGLYPKTVVTAAISVTPKEGCAITPELISSITMAARHHLGITDNDNVSVIDTESGRSWLGSEGGARRLDGTSKEAEQARLEDLWCVKLQEALGFIPNIRIAAAVELETVKNAESGAEPETRRPIGLEFSDDSAAPRPAAAAVYAPKTIAATIAVPESYVRRLSGGEAAEDAQNQFQEKRDEILAQVRELAETIMMPSAETPETDPRCRIEVSLYTDLPEEEARVYRPVPAPEAAPEDAESGISLLPDPLGGELDSELSPEEEISAAAMVRKMMSAPWAGYVLACIAFAAGLVIRSFFVPRGGAEQEKEEERKKAEPSETQNESPAQSMPRPAPQPAPQPAAKPAAQPEPPAERSKIDAARLNELLDRLEDEDFDSGELAGENGFDPADETIAPAGPASESSPFFSSETDETDRKDFRIDSNRFGSDGPHFPIHELGGDGMFSAGPEPFEKETPRRDRERFGFLGSLDPASLRALLDKQRPQTIALIARCASGENRTRVLNALRSRLREEVEKRMQSSEEPDPKVVAAVETSLRESLGTVGETSV